VLDCCHSSLPGLGVAELDFYRFKILSRSIFLGKRYSSLQCLHSETGQEPSPSRPSSSGWPTQRMTRIDRRIDQVSDVRWCQMMSDVWGSNAAPGLLWFGGGVSWDHGMGKELRTPKNCDRLHFPVQGQRHLWDSSSICQYHSIFIHLYPPFRFSRIERS